MTRKGSAVWKGGLKDGKGILSSESGVLKEAPYGFARRFENEPGTNPEELVAAAHAACFSMALSGKLGAASMTAESIETTATATFEKLEAGWTVTGMHLDVTCKIPGAEKAALDKAAEDAKATCPISRLLNTKITMTAKLV